jgi:hypothetical protein
VWVAAYLGVAKGFKRQQIEAWHGMPCDAEESFIRRVKEFLEGLKDV